MTINRYKVGLIAWVWLHLGMGLLLGLLSCSEQCPTPTSHQDLSNTSNVPNTSQSPDCSEDESQVCIDSVCYRRPLTNVVPEFRTRLFSTRLIRLEFDDASGHHSVVKDRRLLDCLHMLVMPQR